MKKITWISVDKIKKNHYIIGEVIKVNEDKLLERITFDPKIFNGKPIIRGKRIAVEHILGMIAEGSTIDELLEGYPFLEKDDIRACLSYAHRLVAHERIEPALMIATA